MCILLSTNSHPEYPLIILNNRDEFFSRPTAQAEYITTEVLAPYDLAREDHGTWIGVSTSGKFASLLNFREPAPVHSISKISRGQLAKHYLINNEINVENWENWLKMHYSVSDFQNLSGFSFLYGNLKEIFNDSSKGIHIFSNRGDSHTMLNKQNEYFGISNSLVDDPWPKVINGKRILKETIEKSTLQKWDENTLILNLFDILSNNTLPNYSNLSEYFTALRHSVFIPSVETPYARTTPVSGNYDNNINIKNMVGKYYGTRTQTIILVDKKGFVTYIEKSLHENDSLEQKQPIINRFKYNINVNEDNAK